MSFTVSKETWLKTEGDRIAALIVVPKFWHRKWDDKSLLTALHVIGLDYTIDEVRGLNDELHKRGIVVDITTPEPMPVVVTDAV